VRPCVCLIIHLFHDGQKLQQTYGSAPCTANSRLASALQDAATSMAVEHVADSFAHFRIRHSSSQTESGLIGMTKWVISGRKKFELLVQKLKVLIDGLQDITKSPRNRRPIGGYDAVRNTAN